MIQRHAVGDAFGAGARVIMAGETHGFSNREEEAAVWRAGNITVRWESDLFPVGGATAGAAIRLDSPFMHIVSVAHDVADLLTPDLLEEWLSDSDRSQQATLLGEVELYRDVVAEDLLGQLRAEAQAVVESAAKVPRAELLLEYLKKIAADLRTWYGLADDERQRDVRERGVSRELRVNLERLPIEIRTATRLERPEHVNDPSLGRSGSMLERLRRFAPTQAGMTIWKVGEHHVDDALALTGSGPVNGAAILHEAQYLSAYMEELGPVRQRETEAFFQSAPTGVGPALQHMYEKGWL